MNKLKALLLLPCSIILSACSTSSIPNLKVVEDFDSNRYLGTWYEIARLDHSFERGLEQVSAHYSMDDKNKRIIVVNRGFNHLKQDWQTSKGKASFVGSSEVGALKVTFFWPFYGAYNIVALDKEYENALVVGPNHHYLWLLSRNKNMPEEVKIKYLKIAKNYGFEVEKLVWVKQ